MPCHRVVNSNGKVGGFSKGVERKVEFLEKEGVVVKDGVVVGLDEELFSF